jgi:hypothetical protein
VESGRGDDFLFCLGRIEFVVAILADNPKYVDCDMTVTQDLLREKSTDLMAAIIRYFNSALIYFRQDFFGNIQDDILLTMQSMYWILFSKVPKFTTTGSYDSIRLFGSTIKR